VPVAVNHVTRRIDLIDPAAATNSSSAGASWWGSRSENSSCYLRGSEPALMTGPLVQVYYSGLPPLSSCGGPAVYSFIGMLLFIVWILFR
jgi:hypothetical protein